MSGWRRCSSPPRTRDPGAGERHDRGAHMQGRRARRRCPVRRGAAHRDRRADRRRAAADVSAGRIRRRTGAGHRRAVPRCGPCRRGRRLEARRPGRAARARRQAVRRTSRTCLGRASRSRCSARGWRRCTRPRRSANATRCASRSSRWRTRCASAFAPTPRSCPIRRRLRRDGGGGRRIGCGDPLNAYSCAPPLSSSAFAFDAVTGDSHSCVVLPLWQTR